MRVTSLFVYPVKSLGGVSLSSSTLDRTGFRHDRRWMWVDASGRFLSQREHPAMATVRVSLEGDHLALKGAVGAVLTVPYAVSARWARRAVTVWDDTVDAAVVGDGAASWLREVIGVEGTLVAFPEASERVVDQQYGVADDRVGFADGFAVLVATEASLGDLNARLDAPVSMARFRPNVVLDGEVAWGEDGWKTVTVGDAGFRVVKPCGRCVMVDLDAETGEARGKVLATLAGFRRQGKRVVFGQNLQHDLRSVGAVVRVGDPCEVSAG